MTNRQWVPQLKLQKNLLRKDVKTDKEYYKHTIYIPPYIIAKLGWNPDGELLDYSIDGGRIIMQRRIGL